MIGFRKEPNKRLAMQVLQTWTEKAELYIEAGKYSEAFECLHEVRDDFLASENPGEFIRVTKQLFRTDAWANHKNYKEFDRVFSVTFRILVDMDRPADYRPLIESYALTINAKTTRYIGYCDMI
jgi:hypothetical protein